jgi:hypothetical protein
MTLEEIGGWADLPRSGRHVSRSSASAYMTGHSLPRWPALLTLLTIYGVPKDTHEAWRHALARVHLTPDGAEEELAVMSASPAGAASDSAEDLLSYDVRLDGLFALGVWSPSRRLDASRLLTDTIEFDARPAQPYVDELALSKAVREKSTTASGATIYLTGFRIDHRESDETQYCRIRQAPSIYPEVLAIEELRIHHPLLLEECDRAVERDVREYLTNAVPSSLAVNLVVLSSENDQLLCVERSAAVDSGVGWWTVGVFETMKQGDLNRPGTAETVYTLAIRGLNEELGLVAADYHPIQISWIGIYRPILRGHVVAVLKLRISKAEALDRARAAHSGYEHAVMEWIPLRRPLIQEFIQARNMVQPGKAGSTFNANDRPWVEQSRLAVLEAWRFRNALES